MAQSQGALREAEQRRRPGAADCPAAEPRSMSSGDAGLKREQVRERLLRDQGSIRELARRYSVNPKTVVRWRKEAQLGTEPAKQHRSLTVDEETMAVAVRTSMLLPLDDCLYLLRTKIPHLSRSTLHRCYQRHGISCLQPSGERAFWTRGAKRGRIGSFVLSHTAIRCADRDFFIVAATDIYSKLSYSSCHSASALEDIIGFIEILRSKVPYRINSIFLGDAKLARAFFEGGWLEQAAAAFPDLAFTRWGEGSGHAPADVSHVHGLETLMGSDEYVRCNASFSEIRSYLNSASAEYYNSVKLKSLKGMTPRIYVQNVWRQNPELFLRPPA